MNASLRPLAAALGLCMLLAAGCSTKVNRAPVEDRPTTVRPGAPAQGPAAAPAANENAGKPGYYTVKPGDTLARIALEHGQNWRDVARWSGVENPNLIEVGQVLRVARPGAEPDAMVARPVLPPGKVEPRPIDAKAAAATPAIAASAPAQAAAPAATADDELQWSWPTSGPVLAGFDEARTKGLVLAGKAGDAVYAAAAGRVVYAGAELRGYGNLLIIKHNNTYLSAYAHNQTLLVKEEQLVAKGQKIAEMGASDAPRVQLHFEIRRGGKPVDPARLLPAR